MKHSRKKAPLLSFAGLILMAVILLRVDFSECYHVLADVELPLLLFSVLLIPALVFCKAVRWYYIVGDFCQGYRLPRAFIDYMKAIFIGILTPGRVGEFSKIYYLRKQSQVSFSKAFATVLFDRIFDVMFLVLASFISLAALPGMGFFADTQWIILVLSCVVLLAVLSPAFWNYAVAFLVGKSWLPDKIRSGVRELTRIKTKTAFAASGLTVASYSIFYLQCFVAAQALGLGVSIYELVAAASLGNLVALLPISLYGIGTRDAAIIAVLSSSGRLPEATALSFSILLFVVFYVGSALIGFLIWIMFPSQDDSRISEAEEIVTEEEF